MQELTKIHEAYLQLDMGLIFNNLEQKRLWLNSVLITIPMLMEKKWIEQQQKHSSIIITMRKLLKLTKISQDLDTQVKEKCLLTCHLIWDQFPVSKS